MTGQQQRAHWSNRMTFILAAAGSAIGLGNIWKFPYITGVNGGGAFVLMYLAFIVAVGIPIFIAELYIGRTSQKNAIQAFEETHKKGSPWQIIGWIGVVSAFLILSFYSVVGGWVLDFEYKALLNQFAGHSDEEIKSFMGGLFSDPIRQLFWHFIFMGAVITCVMTGLKNGIERWNKILMPTLLCILVFLFIYSIFLEGFGPALAFMFSPDTSKLSTEGMMEAVGHAFFTLSLGMGAMITYGSYLSSKENLVKTAFTIAFLDTLIAIIAGVVIFSVVFSFGLEAGKGPSLMFQTLPVLFTKMPGGYFLSAAFFLLVAFAAMTSAVSLLEVVVAYWVEKRNMDRKKATLGIGILIFLLGIPSALSFNAMSEFKIIGLTVFDLFDKLTSIILLPVGGLLISIFYGWVLGPKAVEATLDKGVSRIFALGLLWSARIVAPVAVFVVLINGLKGW